MIYLFSFIASGEDPQQTTPKSRKNEIMYNHPIAPTQANASPVGGVHPHSGEDFEMGSPPWPRTPASPVFNSHAAAPVTPQEYRSTKVKVINPKSYRFIFFKYFNLF